MLYFHSNQNSGNFGWLIKWNGPFQFGLTGIFVTSSEGGPLWPVWSFWSVEQKSPSPFDKVVIPSTALLYPPYKNNNMLWFGLGLCNQNVLFHWARGINKISNWNFCWMELSTPGLSFPTLSINIHPGVNAACNENMVNKNCQKAILTGWPIFLGEGVRWLHT